ncbi:tyrosine aminotransferase, partial [Caerostris extrusa]
MPIRISATLADPPQLQRQEPNTRRMECQSLRICNRDSQPYKGHLEAREAVASYSVRPGAPPSQKAFFVKGQKTFRKKQKQKLKTEFFPLISIPFPRLTKRDVVLTSGCSHALELAIGVLANPGQTILVPRPGFPLYKTLAKSLGINIKYYSLLPEKSWEVDLADLEHQITYDTAAIVVNNPSNPCGSVYSRRHLQSILEVAARNYVPIIADEIYEQFVFPGEEEFLSNRISIPCSWLEDGMVLIHDRNDVLDHRYEMDCRLYAKESWEPTQLYKERCLPFWEIRLKISSMMSSNKYASIAFSVLSEIPGLTPIMPSGALYMMM